MSVTTHIQSNEYRRTVLSYFCLFICLSTILAIPLYWYMNLMTPILVSFLIFLSFLGIYFLNKKGYFNFSRIAILLASNAGVIYFSLFLGYYSGIYLYILAAPLLIYLLYDFQDKLGIALAFSSFVLCFTTIYFLRDQVPFGEALLSDSMNDLIFTINLSATLLMIFFLVIFFANNNNRYIVQLKAHQSELNEEITLRKQSEEQLQKALNDRELLLAEVHHRVKNNLAIISALVNLESTKIDDAKSQKIFEETRNRIYAISMVHNLLYKNPSLQEIDMVDFFNNFCSNIANGFSDGSIQIQQHIRPVNVSIDSAIPMALLLNELITNAFKHAFPNGASGIIEVGLQPEENGGFQFYVADNGIGMKEEALNCSSTGMNIIHSLAEQLDAIIQFQNENGTRFTIIKNTLETT